VGRVEDVDRTCTLISSAWSLSSLKVFTLQQCGSELSVINHRALVIRARVMFSPA
jgi:hypothetical protein